MADSRLTPQTTTIGWRARWDGLPPVARITLIYVAARLVTTALMLLSAQLAPASSRFGPDPDLVDYILGWDAQWYWTVAVDGYPTELPLSATGDVEQNAWAFMPVYAYLAQLVGNVLGAGAWWVGALVVSLGAGWAACVVMHRLLRERLDEDQSLWGVALFASGPLAALFQVGYAESLFLLLLLSSLLCVVRRRWRALYLLVPLMGFTRPGVLAFALFLGLYGFWRLARRQVDPLPRIEIVHIVSVAAIATIVGFAWQAITGVVTGDPGAYLETELAWRRSWTGDDGGFFPFEGWVQAAGVWAGVWGIPVWLNYALLALGVAGAFAVLVVVPQVRRLGAEIRLWSASHVVYLLAVFFPQSSTFRLLIPLAPLAGALAVPRSTAFRLFTLAGCLLGQWAWIFGMYGNGNTFWLIP